MKDCIHPELNFASGDYYVTCARCNAMWMRKARDGRAEYGWDHNNHPVGAAPSEASGNVQAMVAGPRVLQQQK